MAWLTVIVLTLGLAIPGFVVGFDRPELFEQPEMQALVDRLGISMQVVMAAGLLAPTLPSGPEGEAGSSGPMPRS